MTVYCDSSALVKLYVDEPNAEGIRQYVSVADTIATSSIAFVEVVASLTRSCRERRLAKQGLAAATRQFTEDWAGFFQIEPVEEVLRLAAGLAGQHALRALDSIHLASFQRVLERSDDDVEFSSFDERLVKAARKLR